MQEENEGMVKAYVRRKEAVEMGRTCPQCLEWYEYMNIDFCPECGSELALICPYCESLIEEFWFFCSSCGNNF
jgi:rRNA maturation endonuclease Nob1